MLERVRVATRKPCAQCHGAFEVRIRAGFQVVTSPRCLPRSLRPTSGVYPDTRVHSQGLSGLMDFAVVSPFLSLVEAFKQPSDEERPPRPSGAQLSPRNETQSPAARGAPEPSGTEVSPRPPGAQLSSRRETEASAARAPAPFKQPTGGPPASSAERSPRPFGAARSPRREMEDFVSPPGVPPLTPPQFWLVM